MRVFADEVPVKVLRNRQPWSGAVSLIDPLLVTLLYLLLMRLFGERFGDDDAAILIAAFFLMLPSRVPYSRYSTSVVLSILSTWGLVALAILALRMARDDAATRAVDLLYLDASAVWVFAAPAMLVGLHAFSPSIAPRLRRLYRRTNVIIVGMNGPAARVAEAMEMGEAEGQQLVACFDDRRSPRTPLAQRWQVTGSLADAGEYVRRNRVDLIYISLPMSSHPRIRALLDELRDSTASICFLPDIFVADVIQGSVNTIGGLPVVSVCDTPFRGASGMVKRVFDLGFTLMALPVFLPLMLAIAASIRLTSPGPAIFRQRRFGLDGQEIVVWKFRTMHMAEDCDKSYQAVTPGDARVTSVGRFLRKTSLDELPQLVNVLQGSMSLVGPRPHALAVNEQYRRLIPGYMARHKVKPGITGWAQVNGWRGGNDLDSMRKRTEFDLAYLRSWSLALDLIIIVRTAKLLVMGDPRAF